MRKSFKRGIALASAAMLMVAGIPFGGLNAVSVGAEETKSAGDVATQTVEVREAESGLGDSATLATGLKWTFARFGQGISTSKMKMSGSVDANNLKITASAGKIVPANTDGLAFYYTPISADKNFKITGTVKVDSFTLSNGQEGFGMMAADDVGKDGFSTHFWNNSYMASASKVEYTYNPATGTLGDSGNKISMKLGLLSQEKIGVTADNRSEFLADATTALAKYYSSKMKTLDLSCGPRGAGTYNIIGNISNTDQTILDTCVEARKTFVFTIERNNTGYFVTYTDEAGNSTTNKYYGTDNLCQIDKNNIYVGFFASRNANISVSNVSVYTSDPATDKPAEEKPVTKVSPSYKVTSGTTSAVAAYPLNFLANADGKLTIKDNAGHVIVDGEAVKANTIVSKGTTLSVGSNTFEVTFVPDPNYIPGEDSVMSSYETKTFTHTVDFRKYGTSGQSVYVSQDGKPDGTGSYDKPLDIYTAVKYAQPGQTILVKGGKYNLTKTIEISRGIDGTADNMIQMVADPASSERPVFDFSKTSAGIVLAADYWYIQGFDITNTANFQKGMAVGGNNCTVDGLNIYNCGTTGLQISRVNSTDDRDMWPSNNLILNCTSYNNADPGYEDADGFAAKLTIGEGNKFVGCISHHNADDGWDLFAKPESGPIGKVVIENCVAYANGYLLDGTNAGNGNGFKMGGSSITGHHELINSVSFDNKTKGIDSNSCPDISAVNCTSYNNGASNVAFYTSDAANTAFSADGVISFKYNAKSMGGDNLSLKGTQTKADVYKTTNYYWDGSKSVNTSSNAVSTSWFKGLDTKVVPTRNADGSINMNDLLVLTDAAPANAGARLAGVASPKLTIPAVIVDPVQPTTVAPTTEAPTTVAPTTVAPTTVAPTSTAATSAAPTTEVATTETPTAVKPTIAPTTVAPTTETATTIVATTAASSTSIVTTAPTNEATVANQNGDGANTGDSSNAWLYIGIMVMAAAMAGVVSKVKNK